MTQINDMTQVDYTSVILGVVIILAGIVALLDLITRLYSYIKKPKDWVKQNNQDHALLSETVNKVQQLTDAHQESVKQSIEHDKRIKESVAELSNKVDSLTNVVDKMVKDRDADKLAEYKDKIGQSYRYYAERKYSDSEPVPYWNHMEKEALEDLIKAYENHGGKNSFVHSVVEKEMCTWKVI